MTVPYIFASATAPLPLSQLDSNFATAITLGSTSLTLGSTVTSVAGLTLTSATISSLSSALSVGNGGTGLTSLTAGYIPYGNGTSAFSSSANMTFDGTTLTLANDASISGLTVGKGGGAGAGNSAFGYNALIANTTGTNNTATGYQALGGATVTGTNNSAYGQQALYFNTSGINNIAYGNYALYNNTTASNNTAVGYQAGYSGTTAAQSTIVGTASGYNLTTGVNNTFVGYASGYAITTGSKNTILGAYQGNGGGLDIRTASNYIVLSDGDGNPRQVIDSNGNVGIGTSSPSDKLTVSSGNIGFVGATSTINFRNGVGTIIQQIQYSDTDGSLNFGGTGGGPYPLKFSTNGSERMRIDSSGNVGIGTSSPNRPLTVNGTGVFGGVFGTSASVLIGNNGSVGYVQSVDAAGSANYPLAFFGANEYARFDSSGNFGLGVTPSAWGGTKALEVGSKGTALFNYSSTDSYFTQNAYFASGWTYGSTAAASTYRQSAGAHYWQIAPSGTAGNAITFTQAMTLDNSGNLLVGTTSTSMGQTGISMQPAFGGAVANINIAHGLVAGGGNSYIQFGYNAGVIGSVTQSGTTAVLYNVTSDARVKTNIVDAPSGNIDDIKVRSFDWKSDGSHQEYGMVAQELVEVAPYAVHQPQDPEEMMAVDYSKLVPMMIKEIQDLKKRIATLEAK